MRIERNDMTRLATLLACLAFGITACNRENKAASESQATSAPEEAAPLPPAATMHPDDVANVTASYDCEGIRVDIVRGQVARVNLAVDNIIKIERIKDSVPATYQDVGLTFTTADSGAILDDETGRSVACKPVAKPESPAPAGT